ncbi:hypothetical protein [Niallia sp.]|uniref:hypothetical protein n=1 Tax=Niallia sp. TaxID=2837523 RepID=UPI00289CAE5D|nr:hypothetical protein [Niallia sp.]
MAEKGASLADINKFWLKSEHVWLIKKYFGLKSEHAWLEKSNFRKSSHSQFSFYNESEMKNIL